LHQTPVLTIEFLQYLDSPSPGRFALPCAGFHGPKKIAVVTLDGYLH